MSGLLPVSLLPVAKKKKINDIMRAVTGGGGAVGLEAARSILESGGDVICIDRQDAPLQAPWSMSWIICMNLGFARSNH
jgi:nucleoside-diphosphate-sugar epimerase